MGSSSICLNEIENFQDLYSEDEHKVIHVHGNWNRPSTMIVTKQDYDILYGNQAFTHRLASLMGSNNLLFIGFSFSDDYFKKLYHQIINFLGGEHFIIVPNPDLFEVREYANLYLTTIGINVEKTKDDKLDNKSLIESIRGILSELQ